MSGDRGSGTTFTVALVLVLLTIGGVGMGLVQGHLVASRAQAAAELAAIAGAQAAADPCARAQGVAAANAVRLVECVIDGADIVVSVEAPSPSLLVRVSSYLDHRTDGVRAAARAGQAASS